MVFIENCKTLWCFLKTVMLSIVFIENCKALWCLLKTVKPNTKIMYWQILLFTND